MIGSAKQNWVYIGPYTEALLQVLGQAVFVLPLTTQAPQRRPERSHAVEEASVPAGRPDLTYKSFENNIVQWFITLMECVLLIRLGCEATYSLKGSAARSNLLDLRSLVAQFCCRAHNTIMQASWVPPISDAFHRHGQLPTDCSKLSVALIS